MARKTAKRSRKRSARFRASWRGQLRFGLVSFEVQAINAAIKEQSEIHFHLLHEPDHQRIHYAKVCPKHGEVPNEEIIEGYEYTKGKYVEFDKDELEELRTEQERALVLDAFIDSDQIDPIYFDGRMYYLIPSGTSASEPYSLLEAAMEKRKCWGVGQVVFSGREQLAVVRPLDGVLSMAMLNYDAEIRKPTEMKAEFARAATPTRKLRLAEDLVDKWREPRFELASYKDRYRQKVKDTIAAKKKGKPLSVPEEEGPQVINLLDALKRSVSERHPRISKQKKGKARAGSRRSSAKKRKRA